MAEQMMQEAACNVIPAGYKQTEVGVIPEDWALLTIDDVASFSGGAQPAKTFFSSKPKDGYIRLIQIRDYKTSEYETYIPETLARKLCSEYDIMIGRYGPPIFQILKGIRGAYNVALIKVEPKKLIEREYLFYYLKTDKLFSLMDMLSQRSSGQTGVELPALKAYPIPLPPKQEQTAIANVLSDSDALIDALEQLIAKKQAIKSATMQQLLTGRTRLPAFALRPDGTKKGYKPSELGDIPEDWEVVSLGDVIQKVTGGGTPSRANPTYWGNEIPWVTVKDFATFNPSMAQEYITKTGLANSSSNLIPRGTLITSTRMALGKAVVYDVDVAINQDLKAIFPNSDVVVSYLFYWFELNAVKIDDLGSGSTVKGLSLGDLRNLSFLLLSSEEQTAIATILSDMDNELQALTQKLEKARALKQGMMQQLLTGKIRLPLAVGA
ncbi:restriction endonuclease subunit S [Aeromonas veronii]|uniref:restriction endonuclease subunit S n=1 Tax=Aeromonas veronii TaxID=654 RepID=UPI00191DC08A|nr:restriction endonuclease subunit S [Aeromonas veronii]MBL0453702.1 restriction endonuclease subunit S [Aeromonas veronii]